VFQILRFKIWEVRRKAVRRGEYNQVSLDDLAGPGQRPTRGSKRSASRYWARLMEAIDRLAPRCRQLFLWKLEGKSFGEIQKLFGVSSINTIYTWDFRCRKELLEKMVPVGEAVMPPKDIEKLLAATRRYADRARAQGPLCSGPSRPDAFQRAGR